MDIFIYCVPGIPVPLATVLILLIGTVLSLCVSGLKVKSVILAAAVIFGATLALIADADKMLLAAMIFISLAAVLLISDITDKGRGTPRGRRRR